MEFQQAAVLLMCVLAVTVNVVNATTDDDLQNGDKQLQDRLYEHIHNYNYDKALELVKSLLDQDKRDLIKPTMLKLIKNKQSQAISFAYKLYASGLGDIARTAFPVFFWIVFKEQSVVFFDNMYGLPLVLDTTGVDKTNNTDILCNDGDGEYKGLHWKIQGVPRTDDIYFKIQNHDGGRYLKLEESNGEYLAYASVNSDTDKHLWSLQPVEEKGPLSFFIINHHYKKAIKLGDNLPNRHVYGIGGDFSAHPEKYAWSGRNVRDDVAQLPPLGHKYMM